MSKKSTIALESASTFAADLYTTMVGNTLTKKAEVVLKEFIRKDDERQTEIADLNSAITESNAELEILKGKRKAAEKVTNQVALDEKIAVAKADISILQAQIAGLQTLRSAANDRKNAFIAKFDSDPYAALADNTLVLDFVAAKVAKVA